MATRSTIGIEHEDGTISAIYCHWDGYFGHHAPILLNSYDTYDKAYALIAGGSLSILDNNISPDPSAIHNFDEKQRGVCVYYIRDRGEPHVQNSAFIYDSFDDWVDDSINRHEEYNYLFTEGGWVARVGDTFYNELPAAPMA